MTCGGTRNITLSKCFQTEDLIVLCILNHFQSDILQGDRFSPRIQCSSLYHFQKPIQNLSLHIVLHMNTSQRPSNCIKLLYKTRAC